MTLQKVTPFLWYQEKAEEAARFYVSIFRNSRIINANPMMATFELEGAQFIAFNGGSAHQLAHNISLFIRCATQEEVDYFWSKLTSEGGREVQCGWLVDRFGLSWQVVPESSATSWATMIRGKLIARCRPCWAWLK